MIQKIDTPKKPSIFSLLKPYSWMIMGLILFTLLSNGLNLAIPKIISSAIDAYTANTLNLNYTIIEFFIVSVLIFAFTYVQNIIQTYTSERVARDVRMRLISKISEQDYNYIQ
jgi:ATP-binding cassette, subfamily B, bacterial